jgi:hypothetical protein
MYRTRSYRRDVRNRKIAHRKHIVHRYWDGCEWYKHDGQYSKGKIHCSCRMCTYSKFYDLPRLTDLKDREFVKSALEDYYNEENKTK